MSEALAGRRILLTTDAVGGVWTYSLDLAREMSRAGAECLLAVLGPPPSEGMRREARRIKGLRLLDTGLPLDWLAESHADVLASGRRLAELAAAQRCDLVHLHAASLAAGDGFAQPVVSVHHSCLATWWLAVRPGEELPDDFRWRIALVARGLAASNAVVAPTTALAHAVADIYGLATAPITIRNGRHMPANERLAAADARQRLVFTSGRLWDEGKNVATLDRAAGLLDVPILAAGPVAAPGGAARSFSHLRLTGTLGEAELRRGLAAAPVYVSAARYEPFGLGVLEAAQAGCALVLSDIPSFRELWAGACLFVAPDDAEGFARTLARLLGEPALLRRMSARALNRARHYSVEAMARQTMRLHAGLIALDQLGKGAAA